MRTFKVNYTLTYDAGDYIIGQDMKSREVSDVTMSNKEVIKFLKKTTNNTNYSNIKLTQVEEKTNENV